MKRARFSVAMLEDAKDAVRLFNAPAIAEFILNRSSLVPRLSTLARARSAASLKPPSVRAFSPRKLRSQRRPLEVARV
jgi:hypothetical protein